MNAYYDAYNKMNHAEMQRLQPEINQQYSLRGFEFGSMGGYHEVEWDASGFASGVYFYSLRTDAGFIQTKKLLLLK